MNIPDVNVLIAIFRPDHAHHDRAVEWWEDAGLGDSLTVPDVVWSGFVRTATNPRAWESPATHEQVWAFVRSVMDQPTYARYLDAFDTMGHFERLCRDVGAIGNLVSDAYIAACATSLGAQVVTFDRDYRRFDGVRVLELSA
ncbi:TA system VapC family ribonuclease toxin [Nocardioides immobilis]|uniref:TA system VapC family ribonuclease toxin n=1 Tax=Nocardioides immobilis TaxID=2049295 RepID=UPI0015FB1FD1|nr:TA system VapC family ribonuclease toxin [Nocardioides immobilis]